MMDILPKHVVLGVGLLTLLCLLSATSGCRTSSQTEDSEKGNLPWSTPAQWEERSLGVPY